MFRTKRRYTDYGLDGVLRHRNQSIRQQKLDDRAEPHLIARTRSPVPECHDHSMLRMPASKAAPNARIRPAPSGSMKPELLLSPTITDLAKATADSCPVQHIARHTYLIHEQRNSPGR